MTYHLSLYFFSILIPLISGVDPHCLDETQSKTDNVHEVVKSDAESTDSPEPGQDSSKCFDDIKQKIKEDWQGLLAQLNEAGISVDLENKKVSVDGFILREKRSGSYPIEYVVVTESGNTHEALIFLDCKPSLLNAALLSLGLTRGKTVSFREKHPPPKQEDLDTGKETLYEVIPPTGTPIYIYIKNSEWKERPIRYLEDLMIDLRTGQPMERLGWIYIGSRFAKVLQGRQKVMRYLADMEGNVVACYLTGHGNAVFDINSPDGINDSLYDVNPNLVLPRGTKVSLIFSLTPLSNI